MDDYTEKYPEHRRHPTLRVVSHYIPGPRDEGQLDTVGTFADKMWSPKNCCALIYPLNAEPLLVLMLTERGTFMVSKRRVSVYLMQDESLRYLDACR